MAEITIVTITMKTMPTMNCGIFRLSSITCRFLHCCYRIDNDDKNNGLVLFFFDNYVLAEKMLGQRGDVMTCISLPQ